MRIASFPAGPWQTNTLADPLRAMGPEARGLLARLAPGHGGFVEPVVLAGDVLFAGSIGRTDLPGGDPGAMLDSLRAKVLPLPDRTVVLPGHGPRTTMAAERASTPCLRRLQELHP